jgi:hypothetical protein
MVLYVILTLGGPWACWMKPYLEWMILVMEYWGDMGGTRLVRVFNAMAVKECIELRREGDTDNGYGVGSEGSFELNWLDKYLVIDACDVIVPTFW